MSFTVKAVDTGVTVAYKSATWWQLNRQRNSRMTRDSMSQLPLLFTPKGINPPRRCQHQGVMSGKKTKTHFTNVGHVVTPIDAKVKRSFWDNEVKVYCTGHMQVGWPLPQRALQQDEDGVRLWASCVPADQTDPIQTWRRRRPGKTTTTTTTRVTVETLATRRTNCLLWNLWQPPVNKRSPCWPQILSWVTATIYVGIFLHPCCN